ncbi:hypothetical protein FBU31_000333 [Coemansia sp. 'formosensis']|nr:hypothetical protein FBU31_000333 [Coemansia sp. 'formosensis']
MSTTNQDVAPTSVKPVLYTDNELEKAKEILKDSKGGSPSTRERNTQSIAMWMHYCKETLKGDDKVDEEGIYKYVEWMMTKGVTERIFDDDEPPTFQALFNKLLGVFGYWEIQGYKPDENQNLSASQMRMKIYTNMYNSHYCPKQPAPANVVIDNNEKQPSDESC